MIVLWVIVMMSMIVGVGISLEESVVIMIVLGRGMKDGEGMIGMIGEMLFFFSFVFLFCFVVFYFYGVVFVILLGWIR